MVWHGQYCPENPFMWWGGMVMYVIIIRVLAFSLTPLIRYASYFLLFSKFFWDKYSAKGTKLE